MREASYRRDLAEEIDTPADRIAEFIAGLALKMPFGGTQRAAFNVMMAGVIIEWVKAAAADGTLCELADVADGAAITKKDREWLVRVLSEVGDNSQPGLQAKCIDFALGTGIWGGLSEEAIGDLHGVGKAAVSQRVVAIQQAWGLPKARGMKSEAACQTFSQRQTAKHREKPPREPWSFAGLLKQAFVPATA